MRQIKFRAWDKKASEMIYMDGMNSLEIYDDGSGMIRDNDDNILVEFGEDNPLLMQFTGLKDKNGKEIYEGDILSNPKDKTGSVVFYEAGFFLETDRKKDGSVWYMNMTHGYVQNKEVIGNIYENESLLNK